MASEDDGKIKYTLDLDAGHMVEGLKHIGEQIAELGEAPGLISLAEGLTKVSGIIALVGVAAYAMKVAIESALETEAIEKVNRQFEVLAKNAGLAGSELREALMHAVGGYATEQEVLKSASKAILEMGDQAARLPEIMELARKATAVMGGELIDNFERLNLAIASGSARGLKSMGIIIDTTKAVKEYADKNGILASQVNEVGRRQAILDAVLKQSKTSLDGIKPPVETATAAWKKFKVAIAETTEVLTVAIGEKTKGPLQSFMTWLKERAETSKTFWTAILGHGAAKEEAGAKMLEMRLKNLRAYLDDLKKRMAEASGGDPRVMAAYRAELANTTTTIEKLSSRLEDAKKKTEELSEQEKKATGGEKKAPALGYDPEAVAAQQAKFKNDIVKIHEEMRAAQIASTESWAEKERLMLEGVKNENERHAYEIKQIENSKELTSKQRIEMVAAMEEAHAAKLNEMEAQRLVEHEKHVQDQMRLTSDLSQYDLLMEEQKATAKAKYDEQINLLNQNTALSDEQRRQQSVELELQYNAKLSQINENAYRDREAVISRWVYSSNSAADQFARGFASASMRASNSLRDFGAQGAKVSGMLTQHMGNMFVQLGEGSKKGADVMREALLGMVADVAQYYGQMMLATGIFPPNPPVIAGGAALLALSGYLRGIAKRGSAGGGGLGGGSISGMGEISGVPSTFSSTERLAEQQKQAKAVHLEVHGNIFDTDASRQRIAQLVRDSIDATDFSISRVGGVQV